VKQNVTAFHSRLWSEPIALPENLVTNQMLGRGLLADP
jgi:hypothetical protein